ncbi:FAD-dependent oxidoreductase [Rathayibacter soli]|uniref:FAD-dependent oxidoreductase n=1 Tax=Rathayibacter soli TaxID=3144168 RepID=UPI0027E4A581|nr:FAD-dependent oxidoreductase [Glaciibacter superstes]
MPEPDENSQDVGDVLIVGGGLAGLSAAMFLAVHGVKATLVERHESTSVQPRARGQVPPTMEALRVAGVDQNVLDASIADRLHVVIAESLVGQEYHVIVGDENPDFGRFSPAPWGLASQERVEPILERRAWELGAKLRFSTRLESVEERQDDVRVMLRDLHTGEEAESRWRFVIAADGHRGAIREQLDIGWHGAGDLGQINCILFDADLSGPLNGRRFALYHLRGELPGATFVTTDTDGRYALHVGSEGTSPSGTEAEDLVRRAVGIRDLDVNVIDIAPWTVALRIADRFATTRVALIGDAAKLMPPTGGFGGNAAILDAYSLAWKLAAIIRGNAGISLLQTHDDERRPFAELIASQQLAQMTLRTGNGTQPAAPPIDPATILFGFRFLRGAFAPAEPGDTEEPGDTAELEDPRTPSGRPGTRAAFVRLDRVQDLTDNSARNTTDLFGTEFVLLCGNAESILTAERVFATAGLPIRTQLMHDTNTPSDEEHTWPRAFGIPHQGAVLVRPDGIIAWRTNQQIDAENIRSALQTTLRNHPGRS